MADKVREYLIGRAAWITKSILPNWPPDTSMAFYIAGGSMTGDINDVDLFPHDGKEIPEPAAKLLSSTKNASTFKAEPWTLQVCRYIKPSLRALVDSFDYAHIQVGADVEVEKGWGKVLDVYFTQDWLDAKAMGSSWFIGSQYPLSSLMRAGKYHKRGTMSRGSYIRASLAALTATVKRGFADYADFKDQLDAVDLGLLSEDMSEVEKANLLELFQLLAKQR
jgi:hypothetical protein